RGVVPPLLLPVALEVERLDADLLDPLHVLHPIDVRDEHARRIPVLLRDGLPVHEVGDERVWLHRLRDGEGIAVAVDRGQDDVVRIRLRRGTLQEIPEADARPYGRRYELAAHGVADAFERADLLHRVEDEQLVVGDRVRALDVAGDLELPRRGIDARLHERRVDGVVILVRGDTWRDAGEGVDRWIGRRDRRALREAARRLRQIADLRPHVREHARDRQRADRREGGDRGATKERPPPRRHGNGLAREGRGPEVREAERVHDEPHPGVDHAGREIDALAREELSEDHGAEPRRGGRGDDRAVAPRLRDRVRPRDGAADEEQRDDADDEQALRPVPQRLDERDADRAGEHVDDRLAERERRERQARKRDEEGDVEREEHRQAADEQTRARSRVDPAHLWHDTTPWPSF